MITEGSGLSHYRLLEKVGEGGMGVVYRAQDQQLRRDVAIKLLSPDLLGEPIAHARLLREARAASALNHPNVCTIYEAGEAQGQTYIAMELIPGQSLGEIVPREGLPAQTVCRYGAQIADALDHAHQRGIVHRDLKLSNLMVTTEGRIKVLDFGLSRHNPLGASSLAESSTLTTKGTLVGTPLYLAPEAWRGETADERSDIWSLGVVLYQLATGRAPFTGTNEFELSAAILNQEAAPLPDRVPHPLQALILRCLAKDPRQRTRSASDLRAALEALAPDPARPLRTARPVWRAAVFALAALGLAGTALLVWRGTRERAPAHEIRERPLTSFPAEDPVLGSALSPDGKYLAYADTSGYYLRLLDSGETHPLPGTERFAHPRGGWYGQVELRWFPDGTTLLAGARADSDSTDRLWLVSVVGGPPRLLGNKGSDAAIAPDGSSIAFAVYREDEGTSLWRMGPRGEDPRRIVAPRNKHGYESLAWSPDGRRIAYLTSIGNSDSNTWMPVIGTCTRDGGAPTTLIADRWLGAGWGSRRSLCWLPDGRLLFFLPDSVQNQDEGALWEVRVDSRSGHLQNEPSVLMRVSGHYASDFSATSDGRHLAFSKQRVQFDVYVSELLERGTRLGPTRRLTLDEHTDMALGWTADSKSVLFLSTRHSGVNVFQQRLDSRFAEPIADGPGRQGLAFSAPDGAWIYYSTLVEKGKGRWMRVPAGGGPPQPASALDGAVHVQCGLRPGAPCVDCEPRGEDLWFFRFDLLEGRKGELGRIPRAKNQASGYQLSQDGLRVAAQVKDSTFVLDLVTGRVTRLAAIGWPKAEFLNWAADGGAWFQGWSNRRSVLLHVDLLGRVRLLGPFQQEAGVEASPDGRWLAFGRNTYEANVWLIEGL